MDKLAGQDIKPQRANNLVAMLEEVKDSESSIHLNADISRFS